MVGILNLVQQEKSEREGTSWPLQLSERHGLSSLLPPFGDAGDTVEFLRLSRGSIIGPSRKG